MNISRKAMLTFCLCLVLLLSAYPAVKVQASTQGTTAPAASQSKKIYVNVAVATLWKQPGGTRTMDKAVMSVPVNMEGWTGGMTLRDKYWLVGKAETEALYGQEVEILQTKGSWVQVAVKGQVTAKNPKGYPGWMPKSQVITQQTDAHSQALASVKTKTAYLYNPDKKTHFLEVSFNTRLPLVEQDGDWIQVFTPANQVKLVKKSEINIYENASAIPRPAKPADLVATGKQFLGLPYLWSGVSGFGFDCSGFTSSIYKYYGMTIPRDASEQAKQGTPISKNKLQPGDLLFFAYNNGKGKVHHVAMYAGNGMMLHSPNSARSVEIIPMATAPYKQEYAGARRYLK